MTDKRLLLALPAPLALGLLLAACNDAPAGDDSRSASGEVLEGTISDAMLPVERVQSEPPLDDPEAFAEAQESAAEASGAAAESEEGEAAEAEAPEAEDAAEAQPAAEPAD